MSRIEKAIEMAAKKREAASVEAVSTPDSHVSAQPQEESPAATASTERLSFVQTPIAAPHYEERHETFASVPAPVIRNPFLVTATGEAGPASEQYRKLKSAIVKLAQLGRFDKSLMVTSAIGGEGKTLTSLNLAITLAQEFDHTVLLVEADIRRPTIMKYLEMESPVGLTDCVLDGIDVGEALVKTGIGKLSILPAGRTVPNPVELLDRKSVV